MRAARALLLIVALGAAAATAACDRAVEPYSDEPVVEPDLSRIFPPGAERAPQDEAMGGAAARGAPPPAPAASADAGAAAAADPEPLVGRITLAPDLPARPAPSAVVFLILRMGPTGPPVAVKKIESPRFPLAFEIGPDDRMMDGMPFTGPFQLSVRVDSDGNATSRAPGDLHGVHAEPVSPGARNLELVVDQVL